jgi:phosphoribosyl 1,2-cyclic phosphodiesterase
MLGSGSRGNATLVECGGVRVLIDNGFSLRELVARLAAVGADLESIDAVLLTHEHSDHARGIPVLAERTRMAVWTTPGTWRALGAPEWASLRLFSGHGDRLGIGGLGIRPYTVPHDAREAVQFVCEGDGKRLGMLTDAGAVTPHIRESLTDCDALVLECNHDPELLRSGPYPPALQRRVRGTLGHLSNDQAAGLLGVLGVEGIEHLVLAHISAKNNRPELARAAVGRICPDLAARARIAGQDAPGPWVEV